MIRSLLALTLLSVPVLAEEPGMPTPSSLDTSAKPAGVLPDNSLLFKRGHDIGNVGDRHGGKPRRLVQRTIMPTVPTPDFGSILTFDDQLIPTKPGDSSALEIVQDLKKVGAKSYFFANPPRNSTKTLYGILRSKKPKETAAKILENRRADFVKSVRELIKLKHEDQFLCEVYNHTAFHQNMASMKKGSTRYEVCVQGIRFVEECLDEAYAAERPDFVRERYFRFPFLHVPKNKETLADLNKIFIELGLVSLGETQDSKDVLNYSPDLAYQAMMAARKGKKFNPTNKEHGETEQPIALFHTRTWSRIKSGILKAINSTESSPDDNPDQPESGSRPSELDGAIQ